MNTTTFYPIERSEWYRACRALSLPTTKGVDIRAVYTGEKRPPRKGEWFLSGAVVEAYYAHNDLGVVYPIAKIVQVETKTVTTVVAR